MMSAPFTAAHSMPAAMSEVRPCDPVITLTSRSSAFQSNPAVPLELLAVAPIKPAIKVPWLESEDWSTPRPHPGIRLTRPIKSGC